jgi:hypothetical protein
MREVEQSVALTSSLSPSSKRIIALLSKKICDFIIDDDFDKDLTITSDDIPTPDKNRDISVCYSKVEGANIEKTPKNLH